MKKIGKKKHCEFAFRKKPLVEQFEVNQIFLKRAFRFFCTFLCSELYGNRTLFQLPILDEMKIVYYM